MQLGQADDGAQAGRVVLEEDLAALGTGELAHDGQTEAGATSIPAAGVVEPGEALEDLLALARRDSGPVV
jgi:hypothetical protein